MNDYLPAIPLAELEAESAEIAALSAEREAALQLERREPLVLCRIRRCELPARWILTRLGHPNSPEPLISAYCHEHAEESARLLWDGAPRPYTSTARGPFEPGDLRRALGPAAAAEAVERKRQQRAGI